MSGQFAVILGVFLQSAGQILYTTYLLAVPEPVFIFLSLLLVAAILIVSVRFGLPRTGWWLVFCNNLFTAISYLCFFFALRLLVPAVVVAIDIGVSLITGAVIVSLGQRSFPNLQRLIVCAGISFGCLMLSVWQLGPVSGGHLVLWLAVLASVAVGVSSALTVEVCTKLADKGWSRSAVVSQRFYLTLVLALFICIANHTSVTTVNHKILLLIVGITLLGELTPMLLLQTGMSRTDPLTVLVCMSLQPFISFGLSFFSPIYSFDWRTFLGISVVAGFAVFDVIAQARPGAAQPA